MPAAWSATKRESVWRLSGFDAIYLRDEMAPVIPGQTIAIDPELVKAFRPTYRLLAYCLAAGGFPVPNDLAGVDRPISSTRYSWKSTVGPASRHPAEYLRLEQFDWPWTNVR